ncbi:hypothetical protein KBD20_03100, partial [Candidatus Saccharibacteria bacterium]|nr:hypothetical protein [Candidatus Saccharibacteria bacterium]
MRRRRTKKITTTSSNKYVLAGLTLSSALVFSRPIIPAIAYATDANKYIWTKQGLDLIGGESINKAASSANGSSLIASSFDFSGNDPDEPYPLYVSGNYGTNWQNVAEAADPGVANYWISVDISNDGQTMVAISTDGYDLDGGEGQQDIPGKVVLSRNAGASWSDITPDIPLENGGESFVVVSGDGSTIAATNGDSGGEVYITEDGGTNWVTQVPVGGEGIYPTSLSISDNGDKLLMSGMAGSGSEFDSVYITEDGGTNWTGINPFTTDMY